MSRELLEKAAKAAGITVVQVFPWSDEMRAPPGDGTIGRVWNPLTDDGDAFRLAVKLNLRVVFHPVLEQAIVREYHATDLEWVENGESHSDPYAATRLAIVRAAAAIGEAMK